MSVSLCCWGRFPGDKPGERVTVPPGLWRLITQMAPELANAGIDTIQLPPASKAQGGDGAGCDGYGITFRRDLGDVNWAGSVETRYGSAEELRRAVAVCHSHGMRVRLDVVLHQLVGGQSAGTYLYPDAQGVVGKGRGSMQPGCFRRPSGTQDQDPVASPGDDQGFGDELVYANCDPAGYTEADALDYGSWLFRTTGADCGRLDDGKGLWQAFARRFMDHVGGDWVTEWFDGAPQNLARYALSAPMSGRSAAYDFNAHFAIVDACNNYTAYPLANLQFASEHPDLSVIFVESPDTDLNDGESVKFNKLLGYARALTTPCKEVTIHGKDWVSGGVWPGSYGLASWLANLTWIHQTFAYGTETIRWCDQGLFISERDGNGGAIGQSGGLLVGLNFDTYNRRGEWVPTGFGPHVHLHDWSGHGPDIWTDGNGWAYVGVPANAYSSGESYVMYGRADGWKPYAHPGWDTTQSFYGASDLPPGHGQATKTLAIAGRVFRDADHAITVSRVPGNVGCSLTQQPDGASAFTVWALGEPSDYEVRVTYRGA